MNWSALLSSTLLLFAVVNPIGSVPIFLQLTDGMERAERRKTFQTGVLVSAIILAAFIVLGEGILTGFFQVAVHDLTAAGGLLLLIIAIDHLVFGSLVRSVTNGGSRSPHQLGAVPIACPILAGPGAMMTVLVTASRPEQGMLVAAGSVVIVLGLTWTILHFIDGLYRLLGRTVCTVLSKVLCLFIAAIGFRMLMTGVRHYLGGGSG
jgi:multiple antibiotic resistance protein